MATKLVWRVAPPPTGRYRSFKSRAWPSASFADFSPAAFLSCADAYEPRRVRDGSHGPISVRIADYSTFLFTWRRLKAKFRTLAEAKAAAAAFFKANPKCTGEVEGQPAR